MKVDAVLIDDDKTVILIWNLIAGRAEKSLRVFRNVEEFLAEQARFDRDQLVYIDSSLGEDVQPGEFEAKRISELGFKEIYLTTGHSPEIFPPSNFPWLKGIVGKEPPWLAALAAELPAFCAVE